MRAVVKGAPSAASSLRARCTAGRACPLSCADSGVGSGMPDILAAFTGVKKTGKGWTAKCPAHEDHRASLSISQGNDGTWLIKCHAGCGVDAVLAAAHLELRDLFPKTTARQRAEIVAEYDYTDEKGVLLSQAVRLEPKGFRQRRPDGQGGWTWNMNGVRRVLYRLPDLQGQQTVFVVEGE